MGCFALCPYINGAYPCERYPSIAYFADYLCTVSFLADCARIYTADEKDAASPMAWPSHATVEDLQGLPPMVIHANELDLLYDEDEEFYRKLLRAGNAARMTVAGGTFHAADMLCPGLVEDIAHATRASMVEFVRTLSKKKKAAAEAPGAAAAGPDARNTNAAAMATWPVSPDSLRLATAALVGAAAATVAFSAFRRSSR
mmetsp:Transcript_34666/g.67086  ORF Transcript_34666/g.67086 Transcript_34666/m.67086 type:complete len:200 (+) Transcript_34666:59-658(+)